MINFLFKIREYFDIKWKKKHCPHLYNYLFVMSDEERKKVWSDYCKRMEK